MAHLNEPGAAALMPYHLHFLASPQVDQAFPLVQLAAPLLDLDRWRAFARELALPERSGMNQVPPCGIMTAQDSSHYIHGLFCYVLQRELLSDRTLAVSEFCVGSLLDPAGVTEALLGGIDFLARSLGASTIRAALSEDAVALMNCREVFIERFRSYGHNVDGLRFCRRQASRGAELA